MNFKLTLCSLALALAGCMSFATVASAQETYTVSSGDYNGWTFVKNADGTLSLASVDWQFSLPDGVLRIPETVDGMPVTGVVGEKAIGSIGAGTFLAKSNIKAVVFSKNVTTIGSSAFQWCSSIEELDFSESGVKVVGDYAFEGCEKVETLKLPEGCTTVGNSAFAQCSALKTVKLPTTLTTIGGSAFKECKKLASVNLPEGLETIGSYAFNQCESLTSVVIPSTVSNIGQFSFQYCYNISSIEIKDSETNTNRMIEQGAFEQTAVSSVEIPGSVAIIEKDAFKDCHTLETVVIGDGVKEIQEDAFGSCGDLIKVEFKSESNPPTIASNSFTNWRVQNGNISFVVPENATYEVVTNKDGVLANIVKKDTTNPTSIGNINIADAPAEYYDLLGRKVASPKVGQIVIALYADGSARRMLVK